MYYIPTDEITIRDVKLSDILASHRKWLEDSIQGKRADLRGADLSYANLSGANLSYANLSCANLGGADLRRANLRYANLSGANLSGADLSYANLGGADLRRASMYKANLSGANLSGAYMHKADMSGANLSGADLSCANLGGADMSGANLSGAEHDECTSFFSLQCPERGSFIGFKKCGNCIVELKIPANAKRSSATSRKCRCSEAKVISITNADGTDSGIDTVCSGYDSKFVYKIGEISKVENFDENRWEACSTGIHFFITREEAVNYR